MSRRARGMNYTSFFHVIVQGINKEFIFENKQCKNKFFQLMKTEKENYSVDIIAYAIMSNHVHLLIYVEDIKELSNFMKKINEDFARYYNHIKNRVGYVYRDRFLSEPITNQKYLLHCISYIHNNPVKANIVKRCKDYKFSSYNDYIYKTNFVNEKIIELVFGTKTLILNDYKSLHVSNKYYFAEYESKLKENMHEIICEIEKRYSNKWSELIKYNYVLEKIGPEIKERIRISNYELARYLKIHRHKLERILLRYMSK